MPELKFSQEVCDALPSIDAVDPLLRRECSVLDDVGTLVFARQLETVSRKLHTIQYPELKAATLVPINNEAGPATEFLTFRVTDSYVMAKVIGPFSTDIPTVNATAREVTTTFFTVGDAYKYHYDEVRQAQAAGVPLQSRYAEAARRGIELAREEVTAIGVPEKGTYGIANQPNVSIFGFNNGSWATASGEEILNDLNEYVSEMILTTNEILAPDTLVLPVSTYRTLARKLMTVGDTVINTSVLDMFRQMNPGITVISWGKLETAGVGGAPRAVLYKRSSDVLEFLQAVALEQMPTEYHQMTWTTVLRARFGGVAVYQPAGVLYADIS